MKNAPGPTTHTLWLSILLAVVALLQFAGCSTVPTAPSVSPSGESSFEGHMIWKQKLIIYDPPGIIFRAMFDDPSNLQKNPYETEARYQQRIRTINECDESFIFLIHPDFCDYWYTPGSGTYTIVSSDSYTGEQRGSVYGGYTPYGVTIYEDDREVEFANPNDPDAKITEVHHDIWKLSLPDFRRFPQDLRQFKDEGTMFPHFGLTLHTDSKAFEGRLSDKKIGLAVQVRLADCRDANIQYEGPGLGSRSSTAPYAFSYNLPVEILDVWIVDIGTDYSLTQWIRDYL